MPPGCIACKDAGGNRQDVPATGGLDERTLSYRRHACLTHQVSHPATADLDAPRDHCINQTTAVIALMAGCERGF